MNLLLEIPGIFTKAALEMAGSSFSPFPCTAAVANGFWLLLQGAVPPSGDPSRWVRTPLEFCGRVSRAEMGKSPLTF